MKRLLVLIAGLCLIASITLLVIYTISLIISSTNKQRIATTTASTVYQVIHYETNRDSLVLVTVFSRVIGSEDTYIAREAPYGVEVVPDAVDGECILEVDANSHGVLHITPDEGVCKS